MIEIKSKGVILAKALKDSWYYNVKLNEYYWLKLSLHDIISCYSVEGKYLKRWYSNLHNHRPKKEFTAKDVNATIFDNPSIIEYWSALHSNEDVYNKLAKLK